MHVVSIGKLKLKNTTYTNKNGVSVNEDIPLGYTVSVYENIETLIKDSLKIPTYKSNIVVKLQTGQKFKNYMEDKRKYFITISPLKNPTEGIMAFSNDKDSLINNMGQINAYGNRLTEYENDKTNNNNINNLKRETRYIEKIKITYIGYGKIVEMHELLIEPSSIKNIPSYTD
jgi:hypothetical protein